MAQADFLTSYVLELLPKVGLDKLTDEQKNMYVPQILAQLEERIGLELLPKLDEEHMGQFAKMLDREDATATEWRAFWQKAVPNFDAELQKILLTFAEDVRQILAK